MRAALLKHLRTAAARGTAPAQRRALPAASSLRATVTQGMPLRAFASASAGNQLADLTKENPHVDVVRYEHKNRKWSLNHVDYYSEALAIGFLETGLRPGDAVLSWLPLHFSESVSTRYEESTIQMILNLQRLIYML